MHLISCCIYLAAPPLASTVTTRTLSRVAAFHYLVILTFSHAYSLLACCPLDSNEANAQRAVGHLRDYEVPASDTLSIVGDPLLCSDAAYLGHMANDGCSPDFASDPVRSSATDSSEGEGGGGGGGLGPQERYQGESALAVNAEHITVEGSHTITRALKGIRAGEEVFVTYGYDYWLSRRSRVESDNETGEIS